jgi:hypothetical protein
MRGNQGGNGELQDVGRLQIFTRLPKTSIVKFHEVLKSSEASSSLLKV